MYSLEVCGELLQNHPAKYIVVGIYCSFGFIPHQHDECARLVIKISNCLNVKCGGGVVRMVQEEAIMGMCDRSPI